MAQNLPEVKFVVAPLNETCKIIGLFLTGEHIWDWNNYIYKEYPALKNELECVKNDKDKKKTIRDFFRTVFQEQKPKLEDKAKIFQNEWDKINDKIMSALSEIHECEWPKDCKKITAKVTLNYICLCSMKKKTFDVYYRQHIDEMKETCIHEILHLMYYNKWKMVFPKTREKEFEPPYLVWHLLEMVPGIILNDERIQKIFRNKFESYEEYQRLYTDGNPILSYLQNFYDNRKSFEDFLKKSYNFIRLHEKEIRSI